MATQAANIADLVAAGLQELGRNKWTNAGTRIQKYHAFKRLFKKKKVQIDSGYGVQWNVKVAVSTAARNVDMAEEDSVSIPNVLKTASIPWRHTNTSYAIDRREIAMNGGAARIVNLLQLRRVDSLESLAERIEEDFWSPVPSSTDEKTPFGVQYYLVANATTGFNGGNPTGYSAGAAGLDSSTYTRWANFTAEYSNISTSDAVSKIREAMTKTEWEPAVDFPDYKMGEDLGIYCSKYAQLNALETIAANQNDRLGNDIAAMDGRTTIRRVPVMWVPQLESDSDTNAIFGINWGYLYPVVLRGEYMKETVVPIAAKQHTKTEVHTDVSWNMCCRDRRSQWRIDAA